MEYRNNLIVIIIIIIMMIICILLNGKDTCMDGILFLGIASFCTMSYYFILIYLKREYIYYYIIIEASVLISGVVLYYTHPSSWDHRYILALLQVIFSLYESVIEVLLTMQLHAECYHNNNYAAVIDSYYYKSS